MSEKQSNRLTRIVTRRGDKGRTSLGDGSSLAKDAPRIEAMGSIDELNSFVGLFVAELRDTSELKAHFNEIQNDLFDLGGELAMPGHQLIQEHHTLKLETLAETLNKDLPPLTNFILPGGSKVIAHCHVVRSVARRAERRLISLAQNELDTNPNNTPINVHSRTYLNRLSDVCFIAARWLAKENGDAEVLWQPSAMNESE